jgi:hypothetical protein
VQSDEREKEQRSQLKSVWGVEQKVEVASSSRGRHVTVVGEYAGADGVYE